MKLPLPATFEAKGSGHKTKGWVHRTTFAHIQAQLRWRFRRDALDRDWDWLKIWLPTVSSPEEFECYSVVIDHDPHALTSLDLRGRKVRDHRYLVVDYLATNPFDRIDGQGFKYLGVCLMAVAVMRSLDRGMRGRLWLESLPDPRTLKFYENLGMSREPVRSLEGYDVFVLSGREQKETFLCLKLPPPGRSFLPQPSKNGSHQENQSRSRGGGRGGSGRSVGGGPATFLSQG